MASRTVILLPPSEGKASGGDGPPWAAGTMSVDELDLRRMEVLEALGPGHPARSQPTMAAIDRYTGVLYGELDPGAIHGTALRRLRRNVLIASGLWGLAAPTDPIPDYRLKMGSRVDPLGKLSTWWRPHLTAALAPRVAGAVVWDLLPNEHEAAVDWAQLQPRRRVTVQFLDAGGRTVSHWNKLLKGSIVRWLLETGEADPSALQDFRHPQEYRLDPDASTIERRRASLVLREHAAGR